MEIPNNALVWTLKHIIFLLRYLIPCWIKVTTRLHSPWFKDTSELECLYIRHNYIWEIDYVLLFLIILLIPLYIVSAAHLLMCSECWFILSPFFFNELTSCWAGQFPSHGFITKRKTGIILFVPHLLWAFEVELESKGVTNHETWDREETATWMR